MFPTQLQAKVVKVLCLGTRQNHVYRITVNKRKKIFLQTQHRLSKTQIERHNCKHNKVDNITWMLEFGLDVYYEIWKLHLVHTDI